jgi:type I restriction enzyme, S subunit
MMPKTPHVKIGELASPEKGSFKIGPFGSSLKKHELVNSGIPVVAIENILPNNFVPKYRKFITEEKYAQLEDYTVQPNDVLVTTMGTIGRSAVAPKEIGKMIIDSHLFRMRLDKSKVLPKYLCYALNGFEGIQRQLSQNARGAIMKGLNTTILKNCTIPLPPLAEQERIVCLLDRAEALRKLRAQASARMDKFVPALFYEMFGDLREADNKWKVAKIGELTQVKTGGTPSRKEPKYFGGNIPWVKTTEVNQSIIVDTEEKITEEALKNSNCEIFPATTILVAMYGQGTTRGRTGKLGISASTNQACAAILPSDEFDPDYLWTLLQMSYEKIRNLGRGGNQPNLNLSMIKNFEILLPSLSIQREFAQRVQEAREIQSRQAQSAEKVEALYQSMLSRAFAGEL